MNKFKPTIRTLIFSLCFLGWINSAINAQCSDPVNLTQSMSQAIVPFNSVSCSNVLGQTDNSYFRVFDLTGQNPFELTEVQIGVEAARGGNPTQPLTLNLWSVPGGVFPGGFPGNLTLLGTQDYTVANNGSEDGTIKSLALTIPVVIEPDGTFDLLVEIFTPNGKANGTFFFIGSNSAGETGPSYLLAADCLVSTPMTTAQISNPQMQLLMNVIGCEQLQGIPTVSEWGAIILLLGFLTMGTVAVTQKKLRLKFKFTR